MQTSGIQEKERVVTTILSSNCGTFSRGWIACQASLKKFFEIAVDEKSFATSSIVWIESTCGKSPCRTERGGRTTLSEKFFAAFRVLSGIDFLQTLIPRLTIDRRHPCPATSSPRNDVGQRYNSESPRSHQRLP
jgi:hypothetical protein